ncbi:MAG TPA: Ig-like domain-containing protein [Gemmatimonadales bacterium]|nr:Ig-like domain-containing protein [Gemmatimonadales bacterium]
MRTTRVLAISWLAFVMSCSPAPDPSGGGGSGGGGNPGGGPPLEVGEEQLFVEATDPANADLDVDVQQAVTITFNVPLFAPSVDAQSIFFTSPLGPVAGTLAVLDNEVTFTPAEDFPIASPITGTVTTDVVGAYSEEMDDDYTWTFAIESTPVVIASGDGIEQPGVAVSAAGLVMAMWVQNDGGVYRLFARPWEPATGWVEPTEFSVSGETITNLKVFCTENNEAVALWLEGDISPYTIRTARFVAGEGWGATETLTDSCTITWMAFDVHRGGWGGAIYYVITPEGARQHVRYLNADGTWNDPVDVMFWLDNLSAGGDGALYSSYSITNPATGTAITYATRYFPGEGLGYGNLDDTPGPALFGSSADPEGALAYFTCSGDVAIWKFDGSAWNQIGAIDLSDDGYHSLFADLASAPAGEACMTWDFQRLGTLDRNLMGAFMDADGNWTEAQVLESLDTWAFEAVAACTDAGQGWIVFRQDDGAANSIWFARYVPGTGWEAAVEIDDDDFPSSAPRLAAQGPGGCAVWLRANGTTQLMARIMN